MAITYRKLFHLLIDRNIKKGELQEKAGITASIMARLAKDETVKTDTLGKICDALSCQPGDIMENVPTMSNSSVSSATSSGKPAHAPGHTAAAVKNTEKQYQRFTQKDAEQIDRQRLINDIQYQLDVSLTFGSDVLSSLLVEAKQSKPSPSDDNTKTVSNNTAPPPDARHKAPAYNPAIAGNETLSEKLARLRREHASQKPDSSETAPD